MQEVIALGIVALAALSVLWTFYRKTLAGPLSRWLLRRGQVGLAMKVRAQVREEQGCDNCSDS
jgi:hypothetical protein